MRRIALSSSQRFLLTPAPGWSDVAHSEIKNIISTPWGKRYRSLPLLHLQPNQHLVLSHCDYDQAIEIAMRSLTLHDLDWIVHERKCPNHSELQKQLSQLPLHQILKTMNHHTGTGTGSYKVICYANKSFLNSSSGLREFFHKSYPLHDTIPETSVVVEKVSVSETPRGSEAPPQNRIKVLLLENILSVLVSFGGHDLPLFKRGYKFQHHDSASSSEAFSVAVAPLAEHHAAAAFHWMLSLNLSSSSESGAALMKNIDQIIVPFAGTGQSFIISLSLLILCVRNSWIRSSSYLSWRRVWCFPHNIICFSQFPPYLPNHTLLPSAHLLQTLH
jgi:hypothetical protein